MTHCADLHSCNLGTLIRLEPISWRGRQWWRRHVGNLGEGMIDCDHRCGIEILLGALGAGLSVQDTETGTIARGVPDGV